MKRRAISFITVLALCLSLCPTWVLAADWKPASADTPMVIASDPSATRYIVEEDTTIDGPYEITKAMVFDTRGNRYTASNASTFVVTSTGKLYLTTGTIESKKGSGIEVQSGGLLCVDKAGMTVTGTEYGLNISSGTTVQLSGGTFTGGKAAIQAQDYGDLRVIGYAYFDESGKTLLPEEVPGHTTVTVKECTDHVYSYTPIENTPSHSWTCLACGTSGMESCTFDFGEDSQAKCDHCKHTLEIVIAMAEGSLVYDGTSRPDSVTVTVTLDGEKPLEKAIDYEVDYTTGINAGETIKVTVSAVSYEGDYTKTFEVLKDTPRITWDAGQFSVDYQADQADLLAKIKTDLLSKVKIEIKAVGKDLSGDLQFSYKDKDDSDSDFIDGLPTNAGEYEIKASLPETQNYHAASSSDTITLTINTIDPTIEAPVAVKPVYNGAAQKLVTSGSAPDDAEIQFAASENGPWSKDIPTGINAGDYIVWYRVVDEASNYNVVEETPINSVKIRRKEITPVVELEYDTCVYDGGYKEPKVTVRDKDDYWNALPSTEYEVSYDNNQNVGTAAVTVTDKDKGNYKIIETTVDFEITAKDQDALTITNRPNTVTYGDKFTLGTSGGSGSGTVVWEIIDDDGVVATVGSASGQVTVTGVGTATVQATKSEGDSNHNPATAVWTFTADKKSVVATVTAENKTYNGNANAKVSAVVEQGVVSGDSITITGLTGTFSDANAGTNKTVTVDSRNAEIKVNNETVTGAANEKYIVTIPETTTADIAKVVSKIVTPPTPVRTLIYSGEPQELLAENEEAIPNDTNIQVEYALSKDGPYSAALPKATNAGSYEVWYRVPESTNYTAIPADKVDVTIAPKLVNDPVISLDPNSYVYDGKAKEPAVTVKDGNDVIPSSEYTVAYSNNVNVGNATVTVTDKEGGNYTVSEKNATFAITTGGSAVLTSSPQAKNLTYNGQEQELVTVGTATGGSLVYAWKENNGEPEEHDYKDEIPKKTEAGLYKVYYKVKGDGNYTDTASAYVFVTIQPKTVTSPIITLSSSSVEYNGQKQEPGVTSVADGNETIPVTEYDVSYSNNINAGTATVHINDKNGGNYTVSGSKTFEIKKAAAKFAEGKEPKAQTELTYNAKAHPLITAGVPEGGTAVYSSDSKNGPYFTTIPTGTDCGIYTVWAMVLGDANHTDSEPIEIDNVEIGKNTVTDPKIELSSKKFQYNGSEQKPTATVKDDDWNVIPANEYTVTYEGDTVDVGKYTIKITSNEINYNFEAKTTEFEILAADQTPLMITGKPNIVYYGDTIQLGTEGGSGKGTVEWSIESGGSGSAENKGDGQFIIKGVGDITIKATRKSDTNNYADSEDTWTFHAFEKPVTAVVTAADKDFDNNTDAKLFVTVPGTDITITVKDDFKGTFDNADVGTNKTVTFTNISDHVMVTNGANYAITYPETTTASIRPAAVDLTDKAEPKENNNLKYDGSPQELLIGGEEPDGGKWAYSLDGVNYSLVIPKGTDAGAYEVYYKVLADSNHKDTEPESLTANISAKDGSALEVLCSPETFPYDGTAKTPSVVVMDNNLNRVIPSDEYTVTLPQERVAVDSYTVQVEDKSGGNYEFTTPVTGTFKIVAAGQNPFSIVTDKAPAVYYGDTFRLSAAGGSGTGEVQWSVEGDPSDVAAITDDGVVTVNGVGKFTVTAYRKADSSHDKSNEANVTFIAQAKPVTAVVTAKDKKYDGGTNATLSVSVPGTDLVINGVTGTFADENVGTNKTVDIDHENAAVTGTNSDKYYVTYPDTTTASITPAPTSLDKINVTAITSLTYTGTPQALITVTDATTVAGGSMAYSLDGSSYSLVIPTGTYAGKYTVWYKVLADSNHTDSESKWVEVTIAQAEVFISTNPVASSIALEQQLKDSVLTGGQAMFDGVEVPGTFAWTNGDTPFTRAGQYDVTFTPYDRINYKTATTTVAVTEKTTEPDPTPEPEPGSTTTPNNSTSTSTAGSSGTGSASTRTSVRDGVASSVLNTASGNELVNKAIAKQSGNVVIKPEITGDVTKTEVSIPASVVNRLGNETDAALTVSTPIADVTFPNGALDTMSSAGGAVSVVTEQIENTIVLALTANGKAIGDIPGGLTLTVSVENAGPGTVAVLVYEDGTRETVRRSVAEGDVVRIPLNGSVTVEIVDNSKEFADVPVESWAADAVAFASAHELFNGTGEATFSPEVSMSRAMLATVLYNLEGRPEQGLTSAFTDVDSDAWYAASISWAAANDITSGYGDGQFGPDDSITREQLAVMLWRYMGSPVADEQAPDFTDTDQVSSYAMQALCWAIENDILNGYGNGQLDPCGVATRAQVAQMLKNFIENT